MCKGVHPGGMGGMHPHNIFEGGDDTFITSNIGRNCYAIALKHSMSGDGWQGCKSMLSFGREGDDLAKLIIFRITSTSASWLGRLTIHRRGNFLFP